MKRLFSSAVLVAAVGLLAGCVSPELRTARIAVNEKDYDRAMNSLQQELARTPESPEALYLMGLCYENLGDWERMSRYYDRSLAASPLFGARIDESRRRLVARYLTHANAAFDSATALDEAGQTETARALWRESQRWLDTCIIINPAEVQLHRQAALSAYYAGDDDQVARYARRALELERPDDRDLGIREILLNLADRHDDYDAMIKWSEEVMTMVDPAEESEAYLRALDVATSGYMGKGQVDRAEELTRRATQLFPDNLTLRLNVAVFLLKRRDYAAAAEIYRQVLAKQPDHFDANLSLGTILVNEDKWVEAIPYLEKAHHLQPENLVALQNLMAAYYNTGQDDKGLEMRQKLRALGVE